MDWVATSVRTESRQQCGACVLLAVRMRMCVFLSTTDTCSQTHSKVNEKRERREEEERGVGLVGGEPSGTRYRLISAAENEAEESGPRFFPFYLFAEFSLLVPLFLRLVLCGVQFILLVTMERFCCANHRKDDW
jgi:hypothetical protein